MTFRNGVRWFRVALPCCVAVMAQLASAGQRADEHAADLAKYKAMLADAATRLEAESDPDALAAAALFRYRMDVDAALALLDRASRLQLSPPGLTWLQATLCGAAKDCDPVPLEARFRAQDPGNALGWFAEIHRAYAAGNGIALDAALARAAKLPAVNMYFSANIGRLAAAIDAAGALPPGEALTTVAGELSGAPALVQLTAAVRACDEKSLARPVRAESCRALARSMMAGDTVIAEMLGTAIAKRAWPEVSPEWNEAVEARRVQSYRVKKAGALDEALERDAQAARDLIALAKVLPREQDVLVARLEANNINPMPPAGWSEPVPP